MFRQSGFDKLLEKATSHLLMEPDWPTILQICDLIRQNDVQPRHALNALKKKMSSTNPHSAMFAVQLLESMVKNCGSSLHEELTTSQYCSSLQELVRTTPHENVRQKMLELIQAWNFAFRKNPKYNALRDTMTSMKCEGYKFPEMRESDAMFSADSAPVWADGEVCHRCRTQFTLVVRKHHCRACGQVFCSQCSSKNSTLPKFGIEKEVRVCDACYDQVNKPAPATGGKDADMEEYLKSSLAQQSQLPPRKSEEEIREEEELQLALALSQSEAEHKEKEKMRVTSAYFNYKDSPVKTNDRTPTPEETPTNPELARYLNRSYWENRQSDSVETNSLASPSAPAKEPSISSTDSKIKENGVVDTEIDEFVKTLKSQVEIFINRMKSNSSRGRSIANDSSVQTLFMNITAMHSKLLRYIQQHDDSRLYYERLQDKLAQVKDARAALDALREEHREKLRRQAEEAERQRQMLMAHKLDIMRKKKQEYLQYQRQVALQRIQEQEREMQMRQEQQKQQYIMGPQYFIGSPVHGQQFPPNSAPPISSFGYQYGPQSMIGQIPPQSAPASIGHPPGTLQGPSPNFPPQSIPSNMAPIPHNNIPSTGIPPPNMQMHQGVVPQQQPGQGMMQNTGINPNQNIPSGQVMGLNQNIPNQNIQSNQNMPPNAILGQNSNMQPGIQQLGLTNMQYHHQQQPGAPPASPQMLQTKAEDTQTAELITFD